MDKVFQNLKYDLPSGLVVFLVALPLCLGISLASGAPFFSGIIAGIIGGMVIGAISNSQLSVSGPAAGLVAVVLGAISSLGSFEAFLVAVVLSGMMQIALGFLKAGVIANYFPSNVIKGMLSGIGIIMLDIRARINTPPSARRWTCAALSRARSSSVTTITGPWSSVAKSRADRGTRNRRSKITRVSGRARYTSRHVSRGSSTSTVDDPTAIASTSARRLLTTCRCCRPCQRDIWWLIWWRHRNCKLGGGQRACFPQAGFSRRNAERVSVYFYPV